MDSFIDYYTLLGVSKDASKDEIKKAYRNKAKKYHPDAGGSNEEFVLLKQAFDILNSHLKRMNYDKMYDSYKKQEANNQNGTYQKNYETDKNTSKQKQKEEDNEKSKRADNADEGNNKEKSEKPQFNTSQLKVWRVLAIFSVILNFVLIILLLDKNLFENIVGDLEPIEELESYLYSQEEYNKLLHDNSILEDRLTTVLKDFNEQANYINELEQRRSEISTKPITGIETENGNNINEENKTISQDKSYFTLGSSPDEVKQIMGTPSSIIGDRWGYDLSSITFRDGKVTGWSDIGNNLKVNIEKKDLNVSSFTLGSSYQNVIDAMGTPSSIIGDRWGYDLSSITFSDGKVTGWSDISNNLKVR
ncbi:DnaJ domain-containing protein [Robertmurraya massiliosenegalensis]|uniref:J domain-containing protein n=1 Tax=Robertmurraya TaxID=2837507 RepID=UPI0039A5E24C